MNTLGLENFSLVDVKNGVHDVHNLVIDYNFVLFKVFFLFFLKLVFFVLIVAQNLYVEEEILTKRVQ